MAPLVVEGDTLGQKHRNYNKIVNESAQEVLQDISYEEPDLDNLFKIDVACKNRNVEYIMEVLQCKDMLYVSWAIKRSTWLVTDPQYAHIINPTYLNHHLSPNMMAKAFNKLLLHVRLNLREDKRVEEFFNYYKERNLKAAFKWLPNCSIQLVEKIIQNHASDIPRHLVKRLCKRSVSCLHIYMRSDECYYKNEVLAATRILLNCDMEKYLEIIEATQNYSIPEFGPKATKLVMKRCGERVMQNLGKYLSIVHVPTFAKFIKREEIENFITKNMKNKKIRSWFTYNNVKPFIQRLPIKSRFQFIKDFFINKKQKFDDDDGGDGDGGSGGGDDDNDDDVLMDCCEYAVVKKSNLQSIYRWYKFAPFITAFVDLKKLVRYESNPAERTSMFGVMLTCARKDMKNLHTLLKHYRENHINEPFKFKLQFVNLVISYTNTHDFDKETWGCLNDLFSSLGVYSESEKPDQNCVKAVLLYKIVHGENIPDIIEKKFQFDTFKINQNKLSDEGKDKLFAYLHKYLTSKLDGHKINDKKEFSEAVRILTNVLILLVDWKKELVDFPVILDEIKQIIAINRKNKWNEDVSVLYNVQKSWRKLMFEESIALSPYQEVCINALKHGPEILDIWKNEIETLFTNDSELTDRFLIKIRIYWPETLGKTYLNFFTNMINQKRRHKPIIIGICTLLKKKDFLTLVHKYIPNNSKIEWDQSEDVELNICKHIAAKMHLARPQPSPAVALLYAKGDYLQFTLPSLIAILYNISSSQLREHLPKLLDSPVSLQKHGIRAAFAKLEHDELKKLFFDVWKTNKNSSIRAAIFNETLHYLHKASDPSIIRAMWELLSMFIDDLTFEENRSLYIKLSKADKVPISVRPEFWTKSYKFLKTLPPNANGHLLLANLRNKMDAVMEYLDDDFVAEIFLESFNENYVNQRYNYQYLAVEFVLSTRTEEAHIARYNKILVPILERSFQMWDKTHEGNYFVRENLKSILMLLDSLFKEVVLRRKMLLPISMFTDILKRLKQNLPIQEFYVTVLKRKLSLDCVQIFDKVLRKNNATTLSGSTKTENNEGLKSLYAETAPELGKLCVNYLKEDVFNYFPSIYVLFTKSFKSIFCDFDFCDIDKMNALKAFLEFRDFVPGYLFVLKSLPSYTYADDEKMLKSEILKEIKSHPSKEIKAHCSGKKNMT